MPRDYWRIVDPIWPALSRVMYGHAALYRLTGGRIGERLPFLRQMLLLDNVGAKSGVKRTTPLLYAVDGQNLVLVASKGGYPKNPAWFHNLMAHPDTRVQVGGKHRSVHARLARREEREHLWSLALTVYPTYKAYQRRTSREIPLVVLEPRAPEERAT